MGTFFFQIVFYSGIYLFNLQYTHNVIAYVYLLSSLLRLRNNDYGVLTQKILNRKQ